MLHKYLFLGLLIFVSLCHTADGLKVEGTLTTSKDWEFLTRFCFLSEKGTLRYTFEYPVEYETQNILLYFDEENQWEAVYKTGLNCDQKVAVLSPANNQILTLSVLYSWSGCKEITQNGKNYLRCQGGRKFRSSRERWWFVAVSRCDPGTTGTSGLNISYNLHMTNGDDMLHKEFSADEFYILPIVISFLLAYVVMTGISILFAYLLRQRQLFHTTYKMFMVSLGLWTFHLFLSSIAYGRYSDTGYKEVETQYTARAFGSLSYLVFILMLILMAKGYTITRGKLTTASTIKITVFFTLYTITFIVLFIYEALLFDPGEVLYIYESPPGYGLIALRLIGWAWFCYSTFFTLKNYSSKSLFYVPFFIFYTIWFWASPIAILLAMDLMALWTREKTVCGVDSFITLCGHLFFMVLGWSHCYHLCHVCYCIVVKGENCCRSRKLCGILWPCFLFVNMYALLSFTLHARFWAGPIVILAAFFGIDKWVREKTVTSVDLFIYVIGHLFFLILTRPQAANKNFPYHVRTTQIGTLGGGDNELDNFNAYAYAESSSPSSSSSSKGPDFTGLFVTSNSRSTDKLVPNMSTSSFCSNDSPPPYNSLNSNSRRTSQSSQNAFNPLPRVRENSIVEPSSPPAYTSMFVVGGQ